MMQMSLIVAASTGTASTGTASANRESTRTLEPNTGQTVMPRTVMMQMSLIVAASTGTASAKMELTRILELNLIHLDLTKKASTGTASANREFTRTLEPSTDQTVIIKMGWMKRDILEMENIIHLKILGLMIIVTKIII